MIPHDAFDQLFEVVFRNAGFGDVFDGWEEKWEWMLSSSSVDGDSMRGR